MKFLIFVSLLNIAASAAALALGASRWIAIAGIGCGIVGVCYGAFFREPAS